MTTSASSRAGPGALLPIEVQCAYGETFRRLWDFARTLSAAHDEGIDLVRDVIDATAQLTLETGTVTVHQLLPPAGRSQPGPGGNAGSDSGQAS